ncbi:MAG: leucine-rich repeat domain-containing protein [Mycoplasmoidaceae bacterium]|nr:leucine-rich repeat domain-containing protein [Mycoplasmoidaceae bacterium]
MFKDLPKELDGEVELDIDDNDNVIISSVDVDFESAGVTELELQESINFGDGDEDSYNITGINENAFSKCKFKGNISLPNTIQYIGENAFGLNLTTNAQTFEITNSELVIPDACRRISAYAFRNQNSIQQVRISLNLVEALNFMQFFSSSAFANDGELNTYIKTIDLPNANSGDSKI